MAKFGHPREGRRDKLQIVLGLLTNGDGCPVAVEVFEGNTGDPKALPAQIPKIRERFALARVVLVGDRGMLTDARLRRISGRSRDWTGSPRCALVGGTHRTARRPGPSRPSGRSEVRWRSAVT